MSLVIRLKVKFHPLGDTEGNSADTGPSITAKTISIHNTVITINTSNTGWLGIWISASYRRAKRGTIGWARYEWRIQFAILKIFEVNPCTRIVDNAANEWTILLHTTRQKFKKP